MTLGLSGQRIESLPFPEDSPSYKTLELMLWRSVSAHVDAGYDTFICSVSQGMSIVLGEILASIKGSRLSKLKLICVIPFREQAQKWDDAWRTRYDRLLHHADKVIEVSCGYQTGCYQKQSRFVCDACDALLAVYDETDRGRTAYAVGYAQRHGKPVEIINPYDVIEKDSEQPPYYT